MLIFLQLISKFISFLSRSLGLGTGVAWSGEIAMFIDHGIFTKLIPQNSKVVLIAGTNGKTTTAKMIQEILAYKYTVIHNDTGANLENGLVGTILLKTPLFQKKETTFVFEIDESNLPIILKHVTPDILILLNLFRDQLDRYGEVNTIAKKWQESLESENIKKTTLIINGDDPKLAYIGNKLKQKVREVEYFGINDRSLYLEKKEHAVDSTYCPNCGSKLNFEGVYLSHLGNFSCTKCNFSHPKLNLEASMVETSLSGLYMVYNALASALAGKTLGATSVEIERALKNFKPAFGRQEEIKLGDKTIKILLSKNPAGFNASLKTALNDDSKGPLLFVLNDQIPDGRDTSWIWDVDFEILTNHKRNVFCSGDRMFELGLRLKYADLSNVDLTPNLKTALDKAITKTSKEETLWVLATYTAMLETRKILTGRSML